MNLNYQELTKFVKKNLVSIIIVFMVFSSIFGSISVYLIKEYKELSLEKEKFNKERLTVLEGLNKREDLLDAREKEIEFNLKKQDLVLKNNEQKLLENQKELSTSEQNLNIRMQRYEQDLQNLDVEKQSVSENKRIKDAEVRIEQLMSLYTSLGVDRNMNPNCLSAEERKALNQANALYSEILTIANKNNLKNKYIDFFRQNGTFTIIKMGC
ncbi:hypothetical protein BFR75_08565 [Acinetobacter pittii]|uniref:hypothetical protein n=1 Tax=Acinetobacter pittii TaxID=48296 RepID=UPI0008381D65|nr:hypothetical protein [Acinetobacter pittii]OCY31904.1 hypothetical protein BFR75_08565 [Acinetobacter pittii]